MSSRIREKYLDVSRFVAIFLVIVHHVRDFSGNPAAWAGMTWLENLCLVASLSIFFMVSGYLSRSLMSGGDIVKFVRRSVVCLWPALTVVLGGHALAQVILRGTCSAPPCGWLRLSFSIGWFFWCLVLCEAMTFAACLACRKRPRLLPVALIAGFAVLWALPVGMFHAVEMLPAYWFGLFALPRLLQSRWTLSIGIVALVSYLAVAIGCADFTTCGLSFHDETSHLLGLTARGLALQIARWLLSLTGGVGGILVIRATVARWPAFGRLAPLGTQTLGVFFLHLLLLAAYYETIGWTGGGLVGRLAVTSAVFAVAFVLSVLTNRWRPLAGVLWNPLLLVPRKGCV